MEENLQQSWAEYREASRMESLVQSAGAPEPRRGPRTPPGYVPVEQAVYTRPNAVFLERQRLEDAEREARALAAAPKMSLGTFRRLVAAGDLAVERAF